LFALANLFYFTGKFQSYSVKPGERADSMDNTYSENNYTLNSTGEKISYKIRMMIVDDHEVVRRGLAMVIGLEDDIEVCCEAGSGTEAVRSIVESAPDFVLMDYKMPGMNGLDAAKAIKSVLPACKVMILTGVDADSTILEALESGIDGYILKEAPPEELIRAIHIVVSGQAYLHPVVTRKVLSSLNRCGKSAYATSPAASVAPGSNTGSGGGRDGLINSMNGQDRIASDFNSPVKQNGVVERLSEREIEVLKEVALGQNNREIAEALVVSEETVRTHLKSAFRKLSVNDRTQAVVVALKQGIISI
jgi:two-component system response regulator DegU